MSNKNLQKAAVHSIYWMWPLITVNWRNTFIHVFYREIKVRVYYCSANIKKHSEFYYTNCNKNELVANGGPGPSHNYTTVWCITPT